MKTNPPAIRYWKQLSSTDPPAPLAGQCLPLASHILPSARYAFPSALSHRSQIVRRQYAEKMKHQSAAIIKMREGKLSRIPSASLSELLAPSAPSARKHSAVARISR